MTRDEIEAKERARRSEDLLADALEQLVSEQKLRKDWQMQAEYRLQAIIAADARLDAIRLTLQRHHPEAFESVRKYVMVEDHG